MPIRHPIWKAAEKPVPLAESTLFTERLLEAMILAASKILSDQWMLCSTPSQKNRANANRVGFFTGIIYFSYLTRRALTQMGWRWCAYRTV